jgi:hypothetical protein
MKQGLPENNPHDARLDENDPVWRLLGRAPLAQPDAWFAARTLARSRHEYLRAEPGTLLRIWHWILGGGVVLSVAVALAATQVHVEKADEVTNVQQAFEIVASMDTDSDSSSSSWQDSSR